jgi:hypothetical protein
MKPHGMVPVVLGQSLEPCLKGTGLVESTQELRNYITQPPGDQSKECALIQKVDSMTTSKRMESELAGVVVV